MIAMDHNEWHGIFQCASEGVKVNKTNRNVQKVQVCNCDRI